MTRCVTEPVREVPVAYETDVLVLGAGPAGVSAAICAAREGVSVLLVEQSGDVGGVATTGLMSHWTGNTQGGFYEELLQATAELRGPDGGERQIHNPTLRPACWSARTRPGCACCCIALQANPSWSRTA